MNNLRSKVAIVTGSLRGIGAAIAQKLADNGASVITVAFLASDEAGWINGQNIRANGDLT